MATANSTRSKSAAKAFPLWLHKPSGYWCRKVRGKRHYFSKDKDEALNVWLAQKDDLLAGREPRTVDENTVTIRYCVNAFLTSKQAKLDCGDLSHRHFYDLHQTCDFLIKHTGKERLATDLAPADFRQLRVKLAKKFGPAGEARWNRNIRQLFRYAYDNALIEHPVKFGSEFQPPSQRKHRAARSGKHRLFTSKEIHATLDVASVPMRAIVLLGLNAALGNTDVAFLEKKHVDLAGGWLDYARRKTSVPRRCKLWDETCEAIRDALEHRPAHKLVKDAGLIFITQKGRAWGSEEFPQSPVSSEFRKMLDLTRLYAPGKSFYSLRHCFRTVADDCLDQPAIDVVMGHSRNDIASHYRHRVSDERLAKVSDTVFAWFDSGRPKR